MRPSWLCWSSLLIPYRRRHREHGDRAGTPTRLSMMAASGWCVTAIYSDALLAFYDQELYVFM